MKAVHRDDAFENECNPNRPVLASLRQLYLDRWNFRDGLPSYPDCTYACIDSCVKTSKLLDALNTHLVLKLSTYVKRLGTYYILAFVKHERSEKFLNYQEESRSSLRVIGRPDL